MNVQYSYARAILQGTIVDAETKKPIVGASIFIKNNVGGTLTNQQGYYSLPLPLGEYLVSFSAVGYRTQIKSVILTNDLTLNIELLTITQELEEVIVTSKTPDHNVRDVQMSVIELNIQSLNKIPVVLGETDIIKAFTLQPGVTTVGEGAGGFNVRGGRVDQNLILLDGAPLFNTSHLLGFFTSVNPDIVGNATLYKGGIPAQYGGRLSSLLIMNSRSGNNERVRFSYGINPISNRLVIDGPLLNKKLTFLVGGRIAYPNLILRMFPEQFKGNRAFFYDVNAKLEYKINESNNLSLSLYRSADQFKFPEDTLYSWNSNTASLQWNNKLKENLILNVSGIHSDYKFGMEGLKEGYQFLLTSSIKNQEIKTNLLYTLHSRHKLEAGVGIIRYALEPGNLRPTGNSSINTQILSKEFAREIAAYASEEFIISPALSLQVGIRYSFFGNIGPQRVYTYENSAPLTEESIQDSIYYGKGNLIQKYGGWEPRASLRIGLGPQTSIKLSYNRMRQYLHLISNTTAISPVDFWKLSDRYIPPQVADQVALGFFRNFNDNMIEGSVEAFYKDISNLIEYKNGATLLMNPILETALLQAKGKAYGVELSIQKNKGKLTGQFSYTYSRSLASVQTNFASESINEGKYYPSTYDKPHNLAIAAQLALGRNWTFSSNFVYTTGRPATYPDGQYVLNGTTVVDYSKRNADRIPDYHRLDFSIIKDTRRNKEQKHYSTWVFSIYNFYARKNPYSIYFTGKKTVIRSYRLSVLGAFIPSMTLNFHF